MPEPPSPNQLARSVVSERLGRLYRHGRLLRRLLRLLEDADRLGLHLTTADRLLTVAASEDVAPANRREVSHA